MQRIFSITCSLCFLLCAVATESSANVVNTDLTNNPALAALVGAVVPATHMLQDPECEKQELRTARARVAYDCCDSKAALEAHYKAILLAIERAQAVCEEVGCDNIGFVCISTQTRRAFGECFAVAKVDYVCCCPCPTDFECNCLDIDKTPCEGQEVQKVTAEAKFECGDLNSTLDAIKSALSEQFEIALATCEESGCDITDVRGICITFEKLDDKTGLATSALYFACCCEC